MGERASGLDLYHVDPGRCKVPSQPPPSPLPMSDTSRHIDRLLEWTGERCVPWVDDLQVLYEHLHRYFFAADLAEGKRVLDLGCGEGYGSAILAERAKDVLGVELDPEAVEHAATNYPLDNVEFRQASVLELDDLPDRSFDLVVCYEVLEHITEHDELFALAHRVLCPDGIFVISTPDREIYSEAADYHNPYHVKELSLREFDVLLGRFFSHHELWGQIVTVGSTLERIDRAPGAGHPDQIFVRRAGDRWERRKAGPVPYLVAVASQKTLPPIPDLSLLNDPESGALAAPAASVPAAFSQGDVDAGTDREYELWEPERLRRQVVIFEAAVAAEIEAGFKTREEAEDLRRRLDAATAALDDAREHIEHLREEGLAVSGAAIRADDEIAALRAQLDDITGSRAWQMLSRYRSMRAALPGRARRSQG